MYKLHFENNNLSSLIFLFRVLNKRYKETNKPVYKKAAVNILSLCNMVEYRLCGA